MDHQCVSLLDLLSLIFFGSFISLLFTILLVDIKSENVGTVIAWYCMKIRTTRQKSDKMKDSDFKFL